MSWDLLDSEFGSLDGSVVGDLLLDGVVSEVLSLDGDILWDVGDILVVDLLNSLGWDELVSDSGGVSSDGLDGGGWGILNSSLGDISLEDLSSGSLSGDIDGIGDLEDVGSWDVLGDGSLVVDGLSAWLLSGLGDGLGHNLLFLLGASNINSHEVVSEDGLWNGDSVSSLGVDWSGSSGVDWSGSKTLVVATKAEADTSEDTIIGGGVAPGTAVRVRDSIGGVSAGGGEASNCDALVANLAGTSGVANLGDSDGKLVDEDLLGEWSVDGLLADSWDVDEDSLLDLFFVLNVAELVDGDEVVSGLGDLVELDGEVLLGDLLGSLLELEEFKFLVIGDNVVSGSVLNSVNLNSVVSGGVDLLWSGLNLGHEGVSLLGDELWSVLGVSSGLGDVSWLLSDLLVGDGLGGGGINSVLLLLDGVDVCGGGNWDSVSVGSDEGSGEWEGGGEVLGSKVASNVSLEESRSLDGLSESWGIDGVVVNSRVEED